MFNLQPWLEEAFEAEERVQQGLEEDKNIWSKENGKYLLMIKLTKKMYTYFSLPKQKKRKLQQKHSLKDSVDQNRPNPKKH